MRSGTPLWVTESADLGGTGDTFSAPWNLSGDAKGGATNEQFSAGAGKDNNYWFDPTVFSKPAAGTFGNSPRYNIYNPGQYHWDVALFKNVGLGGTQERAVPCGVLQPDEPRQLEWRRREPEQRDLRPRDEQGQLGARHPAQPPVPLLGG